MNSGSSGILGAEDGAPEDDHDHLSERLKTYTF
jgi:hypothetical protein